VYNGGDPSTAAGGEPAEKLTPEAQAQAEMQAEAMKRKVLSANFVPVIAILLASKSYPSLDTGSQIPMLGAVLITPRMLAAIEEAYDFSELPNVACWMITGIVSVLQFATIVMIGQNMGYFKAAGLDSIGQEAAPVDSLDYIQGNPVDVARSGSVKVIEFWATWCGPCETAIPKLNVLVKKLQEEHGADKIQFVGVTNEGKDKVEPFLEKMKGKMDYPVAMDPEQKIASSYPTSGIPHAYVIGKDGNIAWSGHPMSGMLKAIQEALEAEVDVAAVEGATEKKKGGGKKKAVAAAAAAAPAGPKKAEVID